MDAVCNWRRGWPGRSKQYMTLGGFAGCGKTTVIRILLEQWRDVAVCAPTGKACNRLKQVGVDGARTIHSLIYEPYEENGKVRFERKRHLDCSTIVCDEASMVDAWVFRDLLAFGKPILFVGDHGQLEPVGENPNLMHDPDVRLEKIHRQAASNPILRLAAAWREGREGEVFAAVNRKGEWRDSEGRCVVTTRRDYDAFAQSGSQIICGYNVTRHRLNQAVRRYRGFGGPVPAKGESVICLQNNKQYQIFNGQQATVVGSWGGGGKRTIDLELEMDDGRIQTVECLKAQFGTNQIKKKMQKSVALFDYAYALTAHKAQGSEFPAVIVLDEVAPIWDARRWRYTTTTRAVESVVYCL